jgi:hypothetical protein
MKYDKEIRLSIVIHKVTTKGNKSTDLHTESTAWVVPPVADGRRGRALVRKVRAALHVGGRCCAAGHGSLAGRSQPRVPRRRSSCKDSRPKEPLPDADRGGPQRRARRSSARDVAWRTVVGSGSAVGSRRLWCPGAEVPWHQRSEERRRACWEEQRRTSPCSGRRQAEGRVCVCRRRRRGRMGGRTARWAWSDIAVDLQRSIAGNHSGER